MLLWLYVAPWCSVRIAYIAMYALWENQDKKLSFKCYYQILYNNNNRYKLIEVFNWRILIASSC